MNKIVSASEFKAKCLKLIDDMQIDGQPITITKRGKVVAEVKPPVPIEYEPLFGLMREQITIHGDIVSPALDPSWEREWEEGWDRLGFTARTEPK